MLRRASVYAGLMASLPATVQVVIETPRGSLVKWRSNGKIAFVSPLPAPFNYGAVPETRAADGEPADALVLGPRLPRGYAGTFAVHGIVRFLDAGLVDDKLVCGARPPTRLQRLRLDLFFRVYALAKRLGRRAGPTRYEGYFPR